VLNDNFNEKLDENLNEKNNEQETICSINSAGCEFILGQY